MLPENRLSVIGHQSSPGQDLGVRLMPRSARRQTSLSLERISAEHEVSHLRRGMTLLRMKFGHDPTRRGGPDIAEEI